MFYMCCIRLFLALAVSTPEVTGPSKETVPPIIPSKEKQCNFCLFLQFVFCTNLNIIIKYYMF